VDPRRSIQLEGRIDRIDRHQETGQWMILDYKTSDGASPPKKIHRRGTQWIDLQLPLYLTLAKSLYVNDAAELGYIVLPKDCSQVGALVAEWTAGDLHSAYEVARQVAGKILDRIFWPPAPPPAGLFREFAAICQEDALDRQVIEAAADRGNMEDAS
jgi:ATP-dependent helicase/nuclease subunit B